MSRVLVAMSGGVDSSVAAQLLVESGHEVVGVFMRNGIEQAGPAGARSCCSAADAQDAAAVAARLGVPFYAVDYEREFGALIDEFTAEYRRGRTPNPCVLCNQRLKFGQLFQLAEAVGAELVATGHYARLAGGRLTRPRDREKDQTYYLFGVERAALPRIRFPLGELSKAEVRAQAARAGLRTAGKPESMEICFVPGGDYREVVRSRGGAGRPGSFVDEQGRELGRHDGVDGFTVGQRRGLPALGRPHYVQAIDAERGTVTLCERAGLAAATALVRRVRWLVERPDGPLECLVQIRARSAALPARLLQQGEDEVRVEFRAPASAVTPGQAAVFYDSADEVVLGGGWLG